MLAGTTTAWAQLYVCGKEVTTTGTEVQTITGSGISGKVTYDPKNKLLTLRDATITASGSCDGIWNKGVENLYILLEGINKITTSSGGTNVAGIYCGKHTYIGILLTNTHTPSVAVSNTGAGPAIKSTNGANIDFVSVNVTATASNHHAIYADNAATLTVLASTLTAKTNSSSHYAITGFKSGLSMVSGCPLSVLEDNRHSFDETTGSVVSNGTPVQSTTIVPSIMIGDKALSYQTLNINTTTTGASSVSGSVKFNRDGVNSWLELEDFSMTGRSIVCRIPDLEVRIKGSNTITTTKNNTANIQIYANTTFTGNGSLTLSATGTNVSALSTYSGADVTVNINELTAQGTNYGFYGQKAGTLTLKKYSDSSIYKFLGTNCNIYTGKLVMDGMDIWSQKSYFNTSEYKMWIADKGDVACGTNLDSDGTVFQSTSVFTYYPIWVGGTHVNDRNCIYIHSPYITGGKVNYSFVRKTLHLKDVTIVEHGNDNTTNTCGIAVQDEGVTINVTGTNNITAGNWGIYSTKDLTISGEGNLNVTSTELGALAIYDTDVQRILTLQCSGGTHSFKGKSYGFYGWNTAGLEIQKDYEDSGSSALYKFAGETADIDKVPVLIFGDGVNIDSKYTWFNSEARAIYRHDAIAKSSDIEGGTWIRGDVKWIEYPLYICGEQLYGAIVGGQLKGSASGFCCKQYGGSGISYDPETQTLTMNGVTIDDTSVRDVVYNKGIDGLKINMAGANNFRVADNIFLLKCATTISGTGTVKGELAADDGSGIYQSCDLVLDGPTFEFKGRVAIEGGNNLYFNKGGLTFEPNDNAVSALYKLSSVTFGGGLVITEPQDAYYSKSLKAVTTDGETKYSGKVVIEPVTPYDLTIAGVTVTSVNCADILKDGVFSYDPETKILTINGDCTYKGWIVDSKIDGLTINVSGNSTLTQKNNSSILRLYNTTTITGGKLTLKSEADERDALGIYISDGESLTIRDACIEVEGDGFVYGITGNIYISLVIDNSDIIVSAHGNGCIYDWSSITLTNCFVEQPSASIIKPRGIYGTEDYLIGDSDDTETLVIKAGAPVVSGDVNGDGDVNTADVTAVYSYIINGEKSGFTKEAANVNGDNDINTADVTAIYSIIIGGTSGSKKVYEMLLEQGE